MSRFQYIVSGQRQVSGKMFGQVEAYSGRKAGEATMPAMANTTTCAQLAVVLLTAMSHSHALSISLDPKKDGTRSCLLFFRRRPSDWTAIVRFYE